MRNRTRKPKIKFRGKKVFLLAYYNLFEKYDCNLMNLK